MRFKKGQSGNPAGRPKGAKDRRTELRALLVPYRERLVRKAVSLALAGDMAALRLCIDRLMPPLRARDAPITFGPLAGTLAERGEQVLQAMASGEISPDEGAGVMAALRSQAAIVDVDDHERRIAAVERALRDERHA